MSPSKMQPYPNGGADRDRTDDLLNANQALFQLSYGPETKIPIASSYEPWRSEERLFVPQKLFCVIYDGSAISKLAGKFRST